MCQDRHQLLFAFWYGKIISLSSVTDWICRSRWLYRRRLYCSDSSLAGITCLNPASSMDICLLQFLCVVRQSPTECGVPECDLGKVTMRRSGPLGTVVLQLKGQKISCSPQSVLCGDIYYYKWVRIHYFLLNFVYCFLKSNSISCA